MKEGKLASNPEDELEHILKLLKGSEDVVTQTIRAGQPLSQIFHVLSCSGMVDMQTMYMALLPQLEKLAEIIRDDTKATVNIGYSTPADPEHLEGLYGNRVRLETEEDIKQFYASLYSGTVMVIHDASRYVFQFDLSSQPGRQPEESAMEISLKGPRDGFIEKIATNIALVRRRMRTPDLHCEYWKIGTQSQTEVALLYMESHANPLLVKEARERLNNIEVEALHGAAELEEMVSDRSYSLFPLVEYVGRPDYVIQTLMKGRIAMLVDGSPSAIIAPGNLTLLIKSPEDTHIPFYFVSLERLLRIVGLFLALCLPGFWVALCSFNIDQIPFSLLATITIARRGLPISSTMEMFLMLSMFELFREAGVRLPRAVGQTVTVVGGLIIGDAAISAGLTSPTMLVTAAVTSVATFTLVNQSLSGTVSVIRYGVLLMSSFLGIFGFFISIFIVLIYMCSLESFGRPYMEPIAPIKWRQLIPALLQSPWNIKVKGKGK